MGIAAAGSIRWLARLSCLLAWVTGAGVVQDANHGKESAMIELGYGSERKVVGCV